eukprot:SAG31_NODE_252_length_19068_cov_18.307713_4_plen_83_part_00
MDDHQWMHPDELKELKVRWERVACGHHKIVLRSFSGRFWIVVANTHPFMLRSCPSSGSALQQSESIRTSWKRRVTKTCLRML